METVPRFPSRRGRAAAGALFLAAALLAAGCQSARQPVPRNPRVRSAVRVQGRSIVERACRAHGGLASWQRLQDATFQFDDRWSGLAARALRPWPVPEAKGEFQMRVHEDCGRLQIYGPKGTITYGIGKQGAWALRGMRRSQESGDIATARTALPAYMSAFLFPFSFLVDDGVMHYMGVKPAPPGSAVYEVLVTFPWYTGDRARDWYVARFDTTTLRLRSVTYTRSQWGPSAVEYTDEVSGYVRADSLWIPTRHSVRMSWPFRPELHEWSVRDIQFNRGLPDVVFRGPTPLGGG